MTTGALDFIVARRGQASQPGVCRAAPQVANSPPRRSLGARLTMYHALVGGDATTMVERRWAAMMRPGGLPPLHSDVGHLINDSLHELVPDYVRFLSKTSESGASRPRWGRPA